MRAELHDPHWLDARCTIGQSELAQACRLSVEELEELVEYGLLTPLGGAPASRVFSAACVQPLREAVELRARFDLDVFVLGLLFSHLDRIAHLERQVHGLHAHLPQRPEREGPGSWHEPHG